jgi:hypothetical protein
MKPQSNRRPKPRHATRLARLAAAVALAGPVQAGGPYSAALNDPQNPHDAPVPGFVGPHGSGMARIFEGFDLETNEPIYQNPSNYVNPLFFAWAETVEEYSPSESVVSIHGNFSDPTRALGPVTGDHFEVVSLGDLSSEAMQNDELPGSITLTLAKPVRDLTGADFVVFENGQLAQFDYGGAGAGGIFAELAYVEVSGDGETFVRFPSTSLHGPLPALPEPLGTIYASLDPGNVHNLAGKHLNADGDSWGTPFDLADVGLPQITHIRIVDIPGNGSFTDSFGRPIYDPWKTSGSGGFDLEAIGAISAAMQFADWPQLEHLDPSLRGPNDDPDGDGIPNLIEYAFARLPWIADGRENLPLFQLVHEAGGPVIRFEFVRDERLVDLVYEVQASWSLEPDDWLSIAHSQAGSPVTALPGQALTIFEQPLSSILGIGVLRKVTLTSAAPAAGPERVFYRVKVSQQPAITNG